MNAILYFLFVAVLSWSEVTVALPLTALEYAFAAVLGVVILKEAVPGLRWLGITLVIGGVVLIGRAENGPHGPGRPTRKDERHATPAPRESCSPPRPPHRPPPPDPHPPRRPLMPRLAG